MHPLATTSEILEHALDLRREFLHARRRQDFHLRLHRRDFDLDFSVVELAFAKFLAEFLPCRAVALGRAFGKSVARLRQQHVEDALLREVCRLVAHAARLLFAHVLDRGLREVADDGIDVAPDIPDFGELGRLDLDEWGICQTREAPRDFGFAHAGGADHEDILGRDLLAQRFLDLLPPPAVAQCDRDRALRLLLADDVLVQFVDDFLGRHLAHGWISSEEVKE